MRNGRVSKPSSRVRRSRRLAMLKMLSATGSSAGGGSGGTSPMTADNAIHDFLTTGRTGRRNAMPDILGEHAKDSTADLPERLEALTCTTSGPVEDGAKAGTSGVVPKQPSSSQAGPSTSGTASTSPPSGS